MLIYPHNFRQKIGFEKISKWLAEKCISQSGQLLIDELAPSTNTLNIDTELTLAMEMKDICLKSIPLPIESFVDISQPLTKTKIEGLFFDVDELLMIKQVLSVVKSILRFFKTQQAKPYQHLNKMAGQITYLPLIEETLEKVVNKQGKINDNASPQLLAVRNRLVQKQQQVSKQLNQILKEVCQKGWAEADATLTMRDGRLVIPVNAAYKRGIKGLIHDESATGKTAYIEPVEAVELNNEIRELMHEEQREIIQILKKTTDFLRPYNNHLSEYCHFLARIDFIRAKALFAIEIGAVKPQIIASPEINLHEARNPLLIKAFKSDQRVVVPFSLQINDNQRFIVISGPNAGGKSVCLTTVGLIQYMFQCAIPIPVSEKSQLGIFEKICIDIGDEQSIENDVSTYSSHLLNLKLFLKNASPTAMILIDELGTGTDPIIGGALAEAILEKIVAAGAKGIITTHYSNLKHFASVTPNVINASMLYDIQHLKPLFILETGQPGSSFAFDIAYNTGLPADVIEKAKEKAGSDIVKFDALLRKVIRDKKYWEQKREKIHQLEKRLEENTAKQLKQIEETSLLRKEIISKAREEAKNLLSQANRQIEQTIRQIRESQADKELTKTARNNLTMYKETFFNTDVDEDEKLKNLSKKISKHHTEKNKKGLQPEQYEPEEDTSINPGDKVLIDGYDIPGEVVASGTKMVVAVGNMLITIAADKLKKINQSEFKKIIKKTGIQPSNLAVELSKRRALFRSGIDVRGMRAEEAIRQIETFVDEAIVLNAGIIKILHGKGDGILRRQIRNFLKKYNEIETVTDEQIEFGGDGITIVKFK